MYELAVKRDFIAQHFLVGGDWGPENRKHSHHYRLELQLAGRSLDSHGFVVDIVAVNGYLDQLIAPYRDSTLNDRAAFKDLNPSIENLARILHESLRQPLLSAGISSFTVKVWEDEIAWVTYRED